MRVNARDRVYGKLYINFDHSRDNFQLLSVILGLSVFLWWHPNVVKCDRLMPRWWQFSKAFAYGKTHRQRDQKSLLQSTIDVSEADTSARIYTWMLEFEF